RRRGCLKDHTFGMRSFPSTTSRPTANGSSFWTSRLASRRYRSTWSTIGSRNFAASSESKSDKLRAALPGPQSTMMHYTLTMLDRRQFDKYFLPKGGDQLGLGQNASLVFH